MTDDYDDFIKRCEQLRDKLCDTCNDFITKDMAIGNKGIRSIGAAMATILWLASIYNGKARAAGINIAANDDLIKMLHDTERAALDRGLTCIAELEAQE